MQASSSTPRLRLSLLALAVTGLLGGCAREDELRAKALFLCKYDQLTEWTPDRLPEGISLAEHVRADELRAARRRPQAASTDLVGTLVAGAQEQLLPSLRKLVEARAAVTRCEVVKVETKGGRATVTVRQKVPDLASLGSAGLSVLQALSRGGEERGLLAQALRTTERLSQVEVGSAREVPLSFIKTPDGWRASISPEVAAKRTPFRTETP